MRVIPEGEREDYAEYAWTLWAAEGMSTRAIAAHIERERGVRISHVTVAELVKEGRAAGEVPSRADVVAELHTATRHMLALLHEAHRTGNLTTAELAREVAKVHDRRARLFGADAPTRVRFEDDPPPPVPPEVLAAIAEYVPPWVADRPDNGEESAR